MRIRALAAGLFLLVVGFTAVSGTRAAPPDDNTAAVKRVVAEEALRAGFPPSLALAVADAASGFDPTHTAGNGARGVMGLHPATARHLGTDHPDRLWDPKTNVQLGIAYLAQLVRAHQGRLEPALIQMERGVLPEQAATEAIRWDNSFPQKVLRLRRRYRAEAQFWVDSLKGAPIAWELLRPDYDRLRHLARLARELEAPRRASGQNRNLGAADSAIERRRRAVLPYLDDFSG